MEKVTQKRMCCEGLVMTRIIPFAWWMDQGQCLPIEVFLTALEIDWTKRPPWWRPVQTAGQQEVTSRIRYRVNETVKHRDAGLNAPNRLRLPCLRDGSLHQ